MIKDSFIELRSIISPTNQFKIIGLSILVFSLFVPTILKLIQVWDTQADYSHGFFVIPVSLFMVWQRRKSLFSTPVKSLWVWFPVFLIGIIVFLISFTVRFNTLTHLSMIVIIISLFLFLTGWQTTKVLLLPSLFLLFMFPIPSTYHVLITTPLKLMITTISAELVQLLGIPVYQEGNLLFFVNTQIEVVEACSGIRSIFSYLMLGCVFALICNKTWLKIIMILLALPVAIFVNIVRVTATGILSNYFGPEIAQGFFHEFAGLTLFAVGFILLCIFFFAFNRRVNTNEQ